MNDELERGKPGDSHYKAFIGPPEKYDLVGAMQFNLLTFLGLRDHHKLLDIGCGSLRAGKLLIPYLQKGNYYGIEPNTWLVDDGLKKELGNEILTTKSPSFLNSSEFELRKFEESFDFILAQSIFSHASKHQILKCLGEVKAVLNPAGLFVATFVVGKTDYESDDWIYPGCVTYKRSSIKGMMEQNNLIGIETKWDHPNDQTWYVITQPENISLAKELVSNLFTVNRKNVSYLDLIRKNRYTNNRITRQLYRTFKKLSP